MRAAAFTGGGRAEIREVPAPEPGPGEVLIEVRACALCGTDRTGFESGSAVTPGHEIAGVVVRGGPGVDLPQGACGVVYLVEFCAACASCRAGSTNMCLDRTGMYGLSVAGGFAEYVVVRADCFLPVEPSLPFDRATSLLDLFGTTRHALLRSGPKVPESLAVIGCGPIGLGAIAVGFAIGVERIYASDVSNFRLKLAAELGAVTIDATQVDTVEAIRALEQDGCEVVVEAAGLALTQRQALAAARPGGRVMIVAHSRDVLELRTSTDLIQREISVIGSEYFPIGQFEGTHALVAGGRLDPGPLLTHDFALDDLQAACDEFFAGETGKVVIHP
jgi:propanol-preferring alcohol dehydrogenase